jgi:hypothetical protein
MGRGMPQIGLPLSTQMLVGEGGQRVGVAVGAVVLVEQGLTVVVTSPFGDDTHWDLLQEPNMHLRQHSSICLQNLMYSKH